MKINETDAYAAKWTLSTEDNDINMHIVMWRRAVITSKESIMHTIH